MFFANIIASVLLYNKLTTYRLSTLLLLLDSHCSICCYYWIRIALFVVITGFALSTLLLLLDSHCLLCCYYWIRIVFFVITGFALSTLLLLLDSHCLLCSLQCNNDITDSQLVYGMYSETPLSWTPSTPDPLYTKHGL